MDQSQTKGDWSAHELALIVGDYFTMLAKELAGENYSKAEHRRAQMKLVPRSKGSIEFKHQNISAVLQDLGLPWISGYKPRSNYQSALLSAIEAHLDAQPGTLELTTQIPTLVGHKDLFVEPPQRANANVTPKELKRLIRRFDPAARDARNRQLGKAGEEFVLKVERQRLTDAGCAQLADRIHWTAHEEGDGAGFDILSYNLSGDERLLEVKTTCGSQRTPFFITRNELRLSEDRPQHFRLMRVHQFANDPRIFILEPPLDAHVDLEPTTYQARF